VASAAYGQAVHQQVQQAIRLVALLWLTAGEKIPTRFATTSSADDLGAGDVRLTAAAMAELDRLGTGSPSGRGRPAPTR
jgi:hypothetical protein